MMRWRNTTVILICVFLIATLAGCSGGGTGSGEKKVYEAKFASVGSTGSFNDDQMKEFIRLVEEKTGGQVVIKYFPDGQLGTEAANQEALVTGTIELSGFSSTMPSILPEFAVFDLPYVITDRAQIDKFLASDVYKEMQERAEEKGYIIFGCSENGFRQITNNVRPIVKPSDLAGLKIRTPSNPARLAMFKAMGSIPSPISFSELFQALQQGVVDGQENPLAQIYGAKVYEVQKYLSMSNHVYSPSFNVASKKWWDTLPADLQQALRDAADEAGVWGRKRGEEIDKELAVKLKEAGLQVNDVDLAAFETAMKPLQAQLSKDFEPGFLERFLAAVK